MFLNGSGSSILMKMAFRYFWKDYVKRVHHSLKVVLNEIQTQGQKLPTKEDVSEVNLQQAIKQV